MAKKRKNKIEQNQEQKNTQTKDEAAIETSGEQIAFFEEKPLVNMPETFDKIQEIPVIEKKYLIEEAAQMLINGFKDHWLPGIKVRGVLMGVSPLEEHSLDTLRNLFIAWGGSSILKK